MFPAAPLVILQQFPMWTLRYLQENVHKGTEGFSARDNQIS